MKILALLIHKNKTLENTDVKKEELYEDISDDFITEE